MKVKSKLIPYPLLVSSNVNVFWTVYIVLAYYVIFCFHNWILFHIEVSRQSTSHFHVL